MVYTAAFHLPTGNGCSKSKGAISRVGRGRKKKKRKKRERGSFSQQCLSVWWPDFCYDLPLEIKAGLMWCFTVSFFAHLKALETYEISTNASLGLRGNGVWMGWVNSRRSYCEKLSGISESIHFGYLDAFAFSFLFFWN